MEDFVDLGAGWFLFKEDHERVLVICDGTASNPDHGFGPAAWGRKPGPVAGLTIAEAHPMVRGRWHQTGEDEGQWFADDDKKFLHGFDEEPDLWPCQIVVKETPAKAALESIDGRVVATQDELVGLLREITATLRPCVTPAVSAEGRMAAVKFRHPHIFGELEELQSSATH